MIALPLALLLSAPAHALPEVGIALGYEQDLLSSLTIHRGARLDLDLLPLPWLGAELSVEGYPFNSARSAAAEDPDPVDLRGRGTLALRVLPIRAALGKSRLDLGAYAGLGLTDLLVEPAPSSEPLPTQSLPTEVLGLSAELRGTCMGVRAHGELSHDPLTGTDLWLGLSYERWF